MRPSVDSQKRVEAGSWSRFGVIPPNANAEFVWRWDVLQSTNVRTIASPASSAWTDQHATHRGDTARCGCGTGPSAPRDLEYERKGVADLFMFSRRCVGWRRVWIRRASASRVCRGCSSDSLEEHYPRRSVCPGLRHLNTHTGGAFTRHFPLRRRAVVGATGDSLHSETRQFWLNMAETVLEACSPANASTRRIDEVAFFCVRKWDRGEDQPKPNVANVAAGWSRRGLPDQVETLYPVVSIPRSSVLPSRRLINSCDSRRVHLDP